MTTKQLLVLTEQQNRMILAKLDEVLKELNEDEEPVSNPIPEPTPIPTPTPTPSANPFQGVEMYVDTESQATRAFLISTGEDANLLKKIVEQPQFFWLGEWSGNVKDYVREVLRKANGRLVGFAVYNRPGRDNGQWSAGGAPTLQYYKSWIDQIVQGVQEVGNAKAIFAIEPDGLAEMDNYTDNEKKNRIEALMYASEKLSAVGSCYMDVSHPRWHSAEEMKQRLNLFSSKPFRGVAINVSNYEPTADCIRFGEAIRMPYIIDTSRNGRGSNGEWCNPRGRALGETPKAIYDLSSGLFDATVWVKRPGESDGNCNGGPNAGQWWQEIALEMSRNSV